MNTNGSQSSPPVLARRLGLGILILYGIGDILGAGIYALVGKVAESAGRGAWISFLISAFLAALTGVTYAELSSRVPKSAGAAAYSAAAFRHPLVPFLVGFLVLASGISSAATVSLAVHGYLQVFLSAPTLVCATAMIIFYAVVSYWGIETSAWTNAVLTVVEVLGLLLVIVVGLKVASGLSLPDVTAALTPDVGPAGVLAAATLAFYAFIGFEDLANLAEEAKNPQKDVPRAILISVAVSSLIYLAVITVVLVTVGPADAAASPRPLLEVLVRANVPFPPAAFAVIAMLAIANTGLTNFVMVSRLLYGMSNLGLLPKKLSAVDAKRQTPAVAVLITALLVFVLAATGGVKLLAQTTSLLLVLVFGTLHLSLIRLRRSEQRPNGIFRAPTFVPWVGLGSCVFLAAYFSGGAFVRTAVILGLGFALWRWGRLYLPSEVK